MYTYTASVVSTVAEVTVTPTKNDSGATIEYLDASDMTLTDADTSADGHQVALAGRQRHQGEGDGRGRQRHPDLHGDGDPGEPDLHAEHGDLWCGVVTVGTITSSGTTLDTDSVQV